MIAEAKFVKATSAEAKAAKAKIAKAEMTDQNICANLFDWVLLG